MRNPHTLETADVLMNVAYFYKDKLGDLASAEPLFRQVLAIESRLLSPQDPQIVVVQDELACSLFVRGKYFEAEPFYRRALKSCEDG